MRGISRGSGVAGSVRTLRCLAMSAECDRMFSSTKKLIGPERNPSTEQIIEASVTNAKTVIQQRRYSAPPRGANYRLAGAVVPLLVGWC